LKGGYNSQRTGPPFPLSLGGEGIPSQQESQIADGEKGNPPRRKKKIQRREGKNPDTKIKKTPFQHRQKGEWEKGPGTREGGRKMPNGPLDSRQVSKVRNTSANRKSVRTEGRYPAREGRRQKGPILDEKKIRIKKEGNGKAND